MNLKKPTGIDVMVPPKEMPTSVAKGKLNAPEGMTLNWLPLVDIRKYFAKE